jgi:hypothetical protein
MAATNAIDSLVITAILSRNILTNSFISSKK